MQGESKITLAVINILHNTPVTKQPGIFRLWRTRMEQGKLSLELCIQIIEQYSDFIVECKLKPKRK